MRADRRLYLDASMSRLVEECDAAFLLAGKGQEIATEDVKRLGLQVWADGRVRQGPEPVEVAPVPGLEVVAPAAPPTEPVAPIAGLASNAPPTPVKRTRWTRKKD